MTVISGDPTTQLAFSLYENKGVYAVLVGSGVSRAAGIPTGWEITKELVKRAGVAAGAAPQDDWVQWYFEHTGQQPNYSTLLEELATTQTERRAIIQGFLEPNAQELEDGFKTPTLAHRAIASMVKSGHIRVIVTTNFDRLMENALRDLGIEPTIVSSEDTLSGAEPLTHSQCYLFKIHGDYKDARILNTDAELGAYPTAFDALLDRIIDEFGLIVAGWSGEWDHALRSAFLRAPSRRYPTFWLSRGQVSDRGQELIDRRKAVVVKAGDADLFFSGLNSKLETIQQSRQLNPVDADMSVAMAKRFLARPEHRIQLDDLFCAETRKIIAHFSPVFAVDQTRRQEQPTDWVLDYESATEPLVRLSAVIGRWGSDNDHKLVLDAVAGLYAEAQKVQSGYRNWLAQKHYPAALVFYGYGMGLTKSGRLGELFKLFDAPLQNKHRGRIQSMNAELAPFLIESHSRQVWNTFEGQERAKAPFSNRLASVLVPRWAPDFAGIESPELLYERFEFLCLLHFMKLRNVNQESLNSMIERSQTKQISLGRISLVEETILRLANEYSTDENRTPLLEAGFAFGSEKYLEDLLGALQADAGW
ncbi:hypothetical protein HBN82_10365 [Pseudomonas lundensis]|uniref:SIR2 family protein n=1 Tax=Pseudomonas lundensis TaxID=86185 RepID=UPI001473D982|nr:SIR2 family protein [Pseudomonas lundensis]NNA16261.1 hypothetical protein [Pseudomonas lundensis]